MHGRVRVWSGGWGGGGWMLHKPSQQAVARHENKTGRWRGERKKDAEGTDEGSSGETMKREGVEWVSAGRRRRFTGLPVAGSSPRHLQWGTAFNSRQQKKRAFQ